MKKYRAHLVFLGLLLSFIGACYAVGELLIPFFVGLFLAYSVNPIIKNIQIRIPNRNVAVTFFLVAAFSCTIIGVKLLAGQVVLDFKRLNNAFGVFADQNREGIDETALLIKSYIKKVYSEVEVEKHNDIESAMDEVNMDSETIRKSLSKLTAFFKINDKEEKGGRHVNWFFMVLYSMGYFVTILYSYTYFELRFAKYFGNKKKRNTFLEGIINDFNQTFSRYFRQRTKVVFVCTLIFMVSFLIIGIPGAIILGIITGLLCYISHFHYLSLIPLSLSCWALSIEQGHSFFLYYGLLIALFILISILEELVFFPKIMKEVSGMNPAVMMLSLSVWGYVLGSVGLFLALPLTTLLLLYVDRLLVILQNEEDDE